MSQSPLPRQPNKVSEFKARFGVVEPLPQRPSPAAGFGSHRPHTARTQESQESRSRTFLAAAALGSLLLGAAASAAFFLGRDIGEWSVTAQQAEQGPSTAQPVVVPPQPVAQPEAGAAQPAPLPQQQDETAVNSTPVVKDTTSESPVIAQEVPAVPPAPTTPVAEAAPAEEPVLASPTPQTPQQAVQTPTRAEPPPAPAQAELPQPATPDEAPLPNTTVAAAETTVQELPAEPLAAPAPAPSVEPQSASPPVEATSSEQVAIVFPPAPEGDAQPEVQPEAPAETPPAAQPETEAAVQPAEPTESPPAAAKPEAAPPLAQGQALRDCDSCPELTVVVPPPSQPLQSAMVIGSGENSVGPFAIGRFEITFDDWAACVAAKGCESLPADEGWGAGLHPVINVSHDMIAGQYLPWLSELSGKTYRLPTAQEWDLADALGGAGLNASQALCWIGNFSSSAGQGCADQFPATAPAGSFQANPLGIFDLRGNVWEWVEDCWSPGFTYKVKPSEQDCRKRRLRGGSWNSKPQVAGPPPQGFEMAARASRTIGFRVARSLP